MGKVIKKRLRVVKKRKAFWPSLTLALISWTLLILIVYQLPPENTLFVVAFLALLFVATMFTTRLFLVNHLLVYLLSGFVVINFTLRIFGIGNLLNALLLLGLFIAIYIFTRQSKS